MANSAKLDLYKQHKDEYVTPKQPVIVDVKPATYLTITGRGEPGGPMFQACVGALYGVAYTIKMTRKKAGHADYGICKLEGQWWGAEGEACFVNQPKSEWNWKLMIRTPDFVGAKDVRAAVKSLVEKGKDVMAAEVKLEKVKEGKCVQALHVGPYDKEADTIAAMDAMAHAKGYSFHGVHHEIYLSDPRRVPAVKLKTILRMPVH